MMLVVTMVRKGHENRVCRVRVTDAALSAAVIDRGWYGAPPDSERIVLIRDELAREAAVRRWFGRHRTWGGDRQIPHRGQVWQSAKSGQGQDAVSGMITLRVSV